MKTMLGELLQTENAIEGLTAFREKRKPNWK
jgi:1,4-dihydroxy-2-naphthoyl-CoA synthase